MKRELVLDHFQTILLEQSAWITDLSTLNSPYGATNGYHTGEPWVYGRAGFSSSTKSREIFASNTASTEGSYPEAISHPQRKPQGRRFNISINLVLVVL